MATFISTVQFTDQGRRDIKSTVSRAEAFVSAAEKMGVTINNVYWTLGIFDGVLIFDAPDVETATALMLNLASMGNVTTQTARAYAASEIGDVLTKLPD